MFSCRKNGENKDAAIYKIFQFLNFDLRIIFSISTPLNKNYNKIINYQNF